VGTIDITEGIGYRESKIKKPKALALNAKMDFGEKREFKISNDGIA